MDTALEFGILGPVEARRGSGPIPLGRPKQRALLAVLLLHPDQVVPIDRLRGLLWGGTATAASVGAIQAYVSNLRRALEPDRPSRGPARVLVSQAGGYRLAVADDAVDAARFEAGTRAGIRLLANGHPSAARDALAAALALWRGPALADFALESFAQLEADRLEQLRLVALEARLDADLAVGAHTSAVPELERLVAEHPLRERLWAALMLALYRSGRQADSLRAYQRCRTSLAAELGLEPGTDLRHLEAQVLAQDASLDWHPPPPAVRAVPGAVPGARVTEGPGALVGRSGPLGRLEAAWDRAAAGRGGIVVVSGEAGIGKTRLVEELAAIAETGGAGVAWGRSHETEAPAFWPWSQVLQTLLADLGPDPAESALLEAGLEADDLAPLSGPAGARHARSEAVDPVDARFRLYRSVSAVVHAAAARRPVALILEDLHWADGPSLELLRFVAAQLGDRPAMVVLTYRDDEAGLDDRLSEALGALARHRVLERVALAGLDADDAGRFILGATGTAVVPALARAVHRRAEGNPFFMTEVIRLLQSEDALARPGTAVSRVPAGVRDVTRRRLAHLPEETLRLLEQAAVAGAEFDLGVVAAAGGTDEVAALDALEPALVSGMASELAGAHGRYRFSHALVRDALYHDLAGLHRARLHARVADALEARPGADEQAAAIAGHLVVARSVVGVERAITALLRAADAAVARLAHEQAELHLRQVLELLASQPSGDERDRRELWVQTRLGLLLGTTNGLSAPEAATVFARAGVLCGATGDLGMELSPLYGLFLFAWSGADRAAAHEHADRLLAMAANGEDPKYLLGGHLAKGMVLFDQGELVPAGRHFEHVVLLADSVADRQLSEVLCADPRASGRLLRSHVLALTGPFEQAERLVDAGLERARQACHPYTQAIALTMAAFAAVESHRPGAARVLAEEAAEFADASQFGFLAEAARGLLGWSLAAQGDVTQGLHVVRRHLAESGDALARVRHFHLALTAEVELAAGLADDALATAEQGLVEAAATGSCFYMAELHRIRGASMLAATPRLADEAEESLRRAVEVARLQGATRLVLRAQAALDSCRSVLRPVATRRPAARGQDR